VQTCDKRNALRDVISGSVSAATVCANILLFVHWHCYSNPRFIESLRYYSDRPAHRSFVVRSSGFVCSTTRQNCEAYQKGVLFSRFVLTQWQHVELETFMFTNQEYEHTC
jgi:hypothetical protein